MLSFLKKPQPIEFCRPPVIAGTRTENATGFKWYEQLIDYERVNTLINGYSGRVAVLDDTAIPTNGYLQGAIEMVYEFTGENGSSGFHGHHVSGIIASTKHGLFKNVKIGFFKVLSASNGRGISDWVRKGIEAAQIEKYEVINASLGSPIADKSIETAVKNFCKSDKCFFVAASGNSNDFTDAPANLAATVKGVISVGALEYSNNEYRVATFSSWGSVTIVAAGVDILSTFPKNKEEYLSGTSMAAPFISGLLASAKAIYPEFTQTDFYTILDRIVFITKDPQVKQGHGAVKVVDFLEELHKLKENPIEYNNTPQDNSCLTKLKKMFSY